MADLPREMVTTSLLALFDEVYAGPPAPSGTWVVNNEPDSGVLGTLGALSAADASRAPSPGRKTAAAHAEHLRFALEYAAKWLRGEVPDADWSASWAVSAVDAVQWDQLRGDLRRAYTETRALIEARESWEPALLTGSFAAAAHGAYHLGALRQIALELKSPASPMDEAMLPQGALVDPGQA